MWREGQHMKYTQEWEVMWDSEIGERSGGKAF